MGPKGKFVRMAPPPPGTEVDYWHKLTPEQRQWLKKFNLESVQDYFKKDEQPLHEPHHRKAVSDAKNHRRADATYQTKVSFPPELEQSTNPERALIRSIDAFSSVDLATHLRKNSAKEK